MIVDKKTQTGWHKRQCLTIISRADTLPYVRAYEESLTLRNGDVCLPFASRPAAAQRHVRNSLQTLGIGDIVTLGSDKRRSRRTRSDWQRGKKSQRHRVGGSRADMAAKIWRNLEKGVSDARVL